MRRMCRVQYNAFRQGAYQMSFRDLRRRRRRTPFSTKQDCPAMHSPATRNVMSYTTGHFISMQMPQRT